MCSPDGVLDDGGDDGLPVGAIDPVTGSLQRQQPRTGDLLGQRLAVREWEHRILPWITSVGARRSPQRLA